MGGQTISARGKKVSVVEEARDWAEALQQAEFRGLGDTREAARYRVARRTGIPERYLKRLRYQWREMTDVAGSQYRALMLAYEELCQRNEAAADEYRAERLELQRTRNAADLERARPSVGEAAARD